MEWMEQWQSQTIRADGADRRAGAGQRQCGGWRNNGIV